MTESPAKPAAEKKAPSALAVFLSKSGYVQADVISHNERTRLFVTSNGGKYQLTKTSGIRVLKGPNYPKATAE